MKKWWIFVVMMPFVLACASIPDPEGQDDSLVIGYFAVDFPDGFFAQSKHTYTSGVSVNIINETTGRKFWVTTSEGYFQFLSNGTDSYSIDNFSLKATGGSVSGKLNKKVTVQPHSIVYLGHLTLVYSKPAQTTKSSLDNKVTYWDFKTSSSFTMKEGELRNFLTLQDPRSPWLRYEVVR